MVTKLQAGPSGVRIPASTLFLFSKTFTPALCLTKPFLKWVRGCFSGSKAAGV